MNLLVNSEQWNNIHSDLVTFGQAGHEVIEFRKVKEHYYPKTARKEHWLIKRFKRIFRKSNQDDRIASAAQVLQFFADNKAILVGKEETITLVKNLKKE